MKELVELKSILDTLYKIQKAYEYESKINSGPYKAPEQIRESELLNAKAWAIYDAMSVLADTFVEK